MLAHSLRDNGTRAKVVALFTPETLKESTVRELQVFGANWVDICGLHKLMN